MNSEYPQGYNNGKFTSNCIGTFHGVAVHEIDTMSVSKFEAIGREANDWKETALYIYPGIHRLGKQGRINVVNVLGKVLAPQTDEWPWVNWKLDDEKEWLR